MKRATSLFPPLIWHVHEMVFGFAAATVAGFLLTAIPNWTGRMPLQRWPLADRTSGGAKLYADIRSVIETARRRSIGALEAIRLTLAGAPLVRST